ncbi:MAG: hypothetical protein ABI781_21325 [Burkholderiales bacterium]
MFSAFIYGGEKFYVITEWDRSVTTIVLTSDCYGRARPMKSQVVIMSLPAATMQCGAAGVLPGERAEYTFLKIEQI